MNKDIKLSFSLVSLKKGMLAFLHRFHLVIFVVVVLGGLAVVVLLLNDIIITSSENNGYTPQTNNATFDQSTIKRIDDLKTRDQAGTQLDLSGRSNPFVE